VIIPNSVTAAALMAPVRGHVLWFPCQRDGFCGVAWLDIILPLKNTEFLERRNRVVG